MAFAKLIYTGDGTAVDFTYPSEVLAGVSVDSQIKVYVDGVDTSYTVGGAVPSGKVRLATAPTSAQTVVVQRETKIDGQYVTYTDNSIIDDSVLNQDSDQMFFLIQENRDRLDDAMIKEPGGSYWAGQGLEVRNAAAGTTSSSLVTVSQLNSAIAGVPSVTLGDGYVWTFSGDASTTAFSLSSSPASLSNVNQLFVSVSGVVQRPGSDFTLTTGSPATLNFTTAPPAPLPGDSSPNILVQIVTGDIVGVTIPDGSIVNADIADGTLTGAKFGITGASAGQPHWWARVLSGGTIAATQIDHNDITDFDAEVEAKRLDQFADTGGDLSFSNSYRIRNLADGAAGTKDACTVSQMETKVASEIAGIGNTRVASGTGNGAAGSFSVSSLSFQPDSVLIMATEGGTDYCHMWTANATWGSWTVNLTSNGFSLSGLDNTGTIHWTAFQNS